MGLRWFFAGDVVGGVVDTRAGVEVVDCLLGVVVVGEEEVVVGELVVGVVGEDVVDGKVVVVVVFVVVFLVIGVEVEDGEMAVLVASWWPWCSFQWARAKAWRCLLVHGVFFLFLLFLLLLFLFLLLLLLA